MRPPGSVLLGLRPGGSVESNGSEIMGAMGSNNICPPLQIIQWLSLLSFLVFFQFVEVTSRRGDSDSKSWHTRAYVVLRSVAEAAFSVARGPTYVWRQYKGVWP